MWEILKAFKEAHPQTKFLIFNIFIYILALTWTTFQSYARLEYSRSDRPIVIHTQPSDHS